MASFARELFLSNPVKRTAEWYRKKLGFRASIHTVVLLSTRDRLGVVSMTLIVYAQTWILVFNILTGTNLDLHTRRSLRMTDLEFMLFCHDITRQNDDFSPLQNYRLSAVLLWSRRSTRNRPCSTR